MLNWIWGKRIVVNTNVEDTTASESNDERGDTAPSSFSSCYEQHQKVMLESDDADTMSHCGDSNTDDRTVLLKLRLSEDQLLNEGECQNVRPNVDKAYTELKSNFSQLQEEFLACKTKLESLERKHKEQTQQKSDAEMKRVQLERNISLLQNELDEVQKKHSAEVCELQKSMKIAAANNLETSTNALVTAHLTEVANLKLEIEKLLEKNNRISNEHSNDVDRLNGLLKEERDKQTQLSFERLQEVQEAERCRSKLRGQVETLEKELKLINEEKDNLKNQFTKVENECSKYISDINQLKDNFEKERADVKNQTMKNVQEIKSLHLEKNELSQNMSALSEQFSTSEENYKQLKQMYESMKQEEKMAKNQEEMAKKKREQEKSFELEQKEKLHRELEEVMQKNENLQKNIELKQSSLKELTAKFNQTLEVNTKLQEEKTSLSKQLSECPWCILVSKHDLSNEEKQMKKLLNRYKATLEQGGISDFLGHLDAMNTRKEVVESLKKEKEQLEERNNVLEFDMKDILRRMEENEHSANTRFSEIEKEKENLKNQNQTLQTQYSTSQTQHGTLKDQHQKLEAQHRNLQAENEKERERLTNERNELQSQLEKVSKASAELKRKTEDQVQKSKNELELKTLQHASDIKKKSDQVSQLVQEKETIQQQLEGEIKSREDYVKIIHDLKEELRESEMKTVDVEKTLASLTTEKTTVESKLSETTALNARLDEENHSNKKKLVALESEKEKIRMELNESHETLKVYKEEGKKMENIAHEKMQLNSKLEKNSIEIDRLKKENDDIKTKHAKLDSELKCLEKEKNTLDDQLSQTRNKLNKGEEECCQLKKRLEELSSEADKALLLEKSIRNAQETINQLEQKLNAHQNDIDKAKESEVTLNYKINELQESTKLLNAKLSTRDTQVLQLEKDKEELESSLNSVDAAQRVEVDEISCMVKYLEIKGEETAEILFQMMKEKSQVEEQLRHARANVETIHRELGKSLIVKNELERVKEILEYENQSLKTELSSTEKIGNGNKMTALYPKEIFQPVKEVELSLEPPRFSPRTLFPLPVQFRRRKALLICSTYRQSTMLSELRKHNNDVADGFLAGKGLPMIGCENDGLSWINMLAQLGWNESNTKILSEMRSLKSDPSQLIPSIDPTTPGMTQAYPYPTYEKILDALNWLTTEIQAGDQILLIIIGQGGLIPTKFTRNPATYSIGSYDACYLPCDFLSSSAKTGEILVKAIPVETIFHYFRRLPPNTQTTIISDFSVGMSSIRLFRDRPTVQQNQHFLLVQQYERNHPSINLPYVALLPDRFNPGNNITFIPSQMRQQHFSGQMQPFSCSLYPSAHTVSQREQVNNKTKVSSFYNFATNTATTSSSSISQYQRVIPRFYDVEGILCQIVTASPSIKAQYLIPRHNCDRQEPNTSVFLLSSTIDRSNSYEMVIDNEQRGVFSWAMEHELKQSNYCVTSELLKIRLSSLITSKLKIASNTFQMPDIFTIPETLNSCPIPL